MPDLDVADVLDDPDFATLFTLIRSSAAVDATGTNVVTAAPPATVVGVIQPAGAQALLRLPDQARQGGAITIWTRFPLSLDAAPVFGPDGVTMVEPGAVADLVRWQGGTYAVMNCDPWPYGVGYFQSTAILRSPT